MLRKIANALLLSCVAMGSCFYLSPGVSTVQAEDGLGGAGAEGGAGANPQLEGKIRQLEQALQKLRQERMSRPSDVIEAIGGEGLDNFDQLLDMWDEVLNSLGDMADRGECDDDLFGTEAGQ